MSAAVAERLWTTGDVAEYLGVSKVTVSRMLHEGKLPRIHVACRTVRFRREEIEALVRGEWKLPPKKAKEPGK